MKGPKGLAAARLLRFQGSKAVMRPFESKEEIQVPAGLSFGGSFRLEVLLLGELVDPVVQKSSLCEVASNDIET